MSKSFRLSAFVAALLATGLSSVGATSVPASSLAEVDVYDRTEGRWLEKHWHDGQAYVVGKPGNEYQIAIRNRGGERILAVTTVDGVNVVSGETGDPNQAGYVLSRWGNLDITGWRKSLDKAAAFYFTALPDSYAARTGRPDNVGVIGVALFREKRPPRIVYAPSVPLARPQMGEASEPFASGSADRAREAAGAQAPAPAASEMARRESKQAFADDGRAGERLGTGHGRIEDSRVVTTTFNRATSYPEQTLTILYDSRANLVARGVIPNEPRYARRDPNPFPAYRGPFVPDPR